MKKLLFTLLAIIPLLSFGQANKFYRQALRATDLKEKIQLLDQVIALEPDNLDAYFYRGLAKNDSGDYQGAIVDYSKIILVEPDADTYFNRGNSRFNLKDLQGAKADYEKAIALDKSFIDARYSLACTKYDLGEYKNAIADFSTLIKIIPDLQIAYTLRAAAYTALEDYKNAIKDYSTAILINPDSDAFFDRGTLFLDIRYYQKARADLNTAIRLNKDNPFLFFYRGASNLFLGKYEDAIKDFSIALKFDSQDYDALLGLSMAYLKNKDAQQAKIYFNKAKSAIGLDTNKDTLELFSKSYWYTKQYYYFKNSLEELNTL
ncbi:tetratricopeptide repeat protein [Aestuariivivens insulae]|uniref:tetratricopeptide repeat protein n=1 Tax=Aestuariivivens insulae TaxID=1621988 RepID=UPI001F56F4D5|nr:tetratricopeptide repeat protein [Aestuariivivens insulae]